MIAVVLLRGVNLGPSRRLAMADLRALLADVGYDDAVTLLQSGNVVLTTGKTSAKLKRELEGQIAAGLGLETEVFVRTRDELAEVVARDPLRDVADNPSRYLVNFLSRKAGADVKRKLADFDVAPERFAVSGREIYSWHPNGIHGSKLASLLGERRLGISATARNWNTVTKLLALTDQIS